MALAAPIDRDAALDIVMACHQHEEFVAEFNRLTGSVIGVDRSPIDLLVDEATGREERDLTRFVKFVLDYVVAPLISEAKDG